MHELLSISFHHWGPSATDCLFPPALSNLAPLFSITGSYLKKVSAFTGYMLYSTDLKQDLGNISDQES